MIEHVEGIGADSQAHALIELDGLLQAQVGIEVARAAQGVAAERADEAGYVVGCCKLAWGETGCRGIYGGSASAQRDR